MSCEWRNGMSSYLPTRIACPSGETGEQMVTIHGGERLVGAPNCPRQAGQYQKHNQCRFRVTEEL